MTGWLVLDIEASGLGNAAFPIEIGWASLAEGGSAGSLLIRPEPDWPLAGWDDIAADVHGIAWLDLIDTGHPAREVCRAFRNAAAGKLLLSDAHIQDQVWLDRLFESEWPPLAPILVSDIRSVVPLRRRAAFDDALHALPRPHRAGPDAMALARILKEHRRP